MQVGKIVQRFEERGFKLVALKFMQPTKQLLEKHYADLKSKPFFPGLVEYMSSGPVVPMVWEGLNAVAMGRKMLGATKPADSEPGTIRGDFCLDVGRNLCHGSDGVDAAKAEIALWFSGSELVSWADHSAAQVYETPPVVAEGGSAGGKAKGGGGGKGGGKEEKKPAAAAAAPEDADKAAKEAAKAREKLLKAAIKEGGKKGVELEGASDMGGLDFFCTSVDVPDGDAELLEEVSGPHPPPAAAPAPPTAPAPAPSCAAMSPSPSPKLQPSPSPSFHPTRGAEPRGGSGNCTLCLLLPLPCCAAGSGCGVCSAAAIGLGPVHGRAQRRSGARQCGRGL